MLGPNQLHRRYWSAIQFPPQRFASLSQQPTNEGPVGRRELIAGLDAVVGQLRSTSLGNARNVGDGSPMQQLPYVAFVRHDAKPKRLYRVADDLGERLRGAMPTLAGTPTRFINVCCNCSAAASVDS